MGATPSLELDSSSSKSDADFIVEVTWQRPCGLNKIHFADIALASNHTKVSPSG